MAALTAYRLDPPPTGAISILLDPQTHLPLYKTCDGAWTSLDGSRFVAPEDADDFEAEALAFASDPFANLPPSTWPEWTEARVELAG